VEENWILSKKNYLAEMAAGLGIEPQVTERIQQLVGLQTA
jgi:hypothetical protein